MQMNTTFDQANYIKGFKYHVRHDMAVMGDPMSGPALGQFEKSKGVGMIIGVVASVVTMGAALPMMASAVLATQIAGGIMFAGGALSGIGAVTGNKKLSKIGGIMSLAGGIGALASGGLSAAGAGGAFAEGSGSTAMQSMAGSMMESVNSVGGALGMGNAYDPSAIAAAKGAADGSGLANQLELAGAAPAADSGATAQVDALTGAASTTGEGGVSQLAGGAQSADVAGAETLKLADPNVGLGAESGGTWNNPSAPVDSAAPAPTSGGILNNSIDPANINNGPNPGAGGGGYSSDPSASKPGLLNGFLKDNAEVLKVGLSALEKGAAYAIGPDQQAELDAKAALYGAQASVLKTQQEVLDYQKNNMAKQVAMIGADDPQIDAKVKDAASKGVPVVFIPAIGAGGVKQTGGAWNAGTANTAQTPARPATFGAQPAAQ